MTRQCDSCRRYRLVRVVMVGGVWFVVCEDCAEIAKGTAA